MRSFESGSGRESFEVVEGIVWVAKRLEDAEMFKNIKKFWDITDNGLIGWFLGFQIKRDRRNKTLSINQHAYLEILAEKFRLTHGKPMKTPIEPGTQYSKEQSPSTPNQVAKMKGVPYNEAIRSILWPAVISRPDIAYAVGILSQFMQNLGPVHWEGVKQIISYLNTLKNTVLPLEVLVRGLLKVSAMPTGQAKKTGTQYQDTLFTWEVER